MSDSDSERSQEEDDDLEECDACQEEYPLSDDELADVCVDESIERVCGNCVLFNSDLAFDWQSCADDHVRGVIVVKNVLYQPPHSKPYFVLFKHIHDALHYWQDEEAGRRTTFGHVFLDDTVVDVQSAEFQACEATISLPEHEQQARIRTLFWSTLRRARELQAIQRTRLKLYRSALRHIYDVPMDVRLCCQYCSERAVANPRPPFSRFTMTNSADERFRNFWFQQQQDHCCDALCPPSPCFQEVDLSVYYGEHMKSDAVCTFDEAVRWYGAWLQHIDRTGADGHSWTRGLETRREQFAKEKQTDVLHSSPKWDWLLALCRHADDVKICKLFGNIAAQATHQPHVFSHLVALVFQYLTEYGAYDMDSTKFNQSCRRALMQAFEQGTRTLAMNFFGYVKQGTFDAEKQRCELDKQRWNEAVLNQSIGDILQEMEYLRNTVAFQALQTSNPKLKNIAISTANNLIAVINQRLQEVVSTRARESLEMLRAHLASLLMTMRNLVLVYECSYANGFATSMGAEACSKRIPPHATPELLLPVDQFSGIGRSLSLLQSKMPFALTPVVGTTS